MEKKPIILFKFATRSRPEKCIAGLNNIINNLADKENYIILVSADLDDTTMYNQDFINKLNQSVDLKKVSIVFGTSKSKIDAINRDIKGVKEDWKILVNFSDDMEFIKYGFDEIIRNHFAIHFPDFNGNMHYNDGFTGDKLSTMSIIGRVYFETVLKEEIYNSEYFSVYCDNEYTEVARRLNKIQYYDIPIYVHNHVANIGGVPDELLKKTESYHTIDKATYERRALINFGLN